MKKSASSGGLFERRSLAIHDFDDDGYADLAVSGIYRTCTNAVSAQLNLYLGGFSGNPSRFYSAAPIAYGGRAPGVGELYPIDYNLDGAMDLLYRGNDIFELLRNNGTATFSIVTQSAFPSGTAVRPQSFMPMTVDDVDGDGYGDVLLSVSSQPDWYVTTTELYMNQRNGTFANETFAWFGTKVPRSNNGFFGWADVNNDNRSDLIAMGQMTPPPRYYDPEVYLQLSNRTLLFVDAATNGILPVSQPVFSFLDFDGDGSLDLVVGSVSGISGSNRTTAFRGLGNGTFEPTHIESISGNTYVSYNMITVDANSDDYVDIIVAGKNVTTGELNNRLYLGGPGGLAPGSSTSTLCTASTLGALVAAEGIAAVVQLCEYDINPPSGIYLFYVDSSANIIKNPFFPISTPEGYTYPLSAVTTLADTNMDGCLDLTFCGWVQDRFCEHMLGHCNGSFSVKQDFVFPKFQFMGAITWDGDFDRDGLPDLLIRYMVTGVPSTSRFSLYLSSVSLQFDSWPSRGPDTSNINIYNVAPTDYDGDGWVDIVVLLLVYRNIGNATFAPAASPVLSGSVGSLTYPSMILGDFAADGDATIDLFLIARNLAGRIYRNLGNGSLTYDAAMVSVPSFNVTGSCTAADYDGDGLTDVFVASQVSYVAYNAGNGSLNMAPLGTLPAPDFTFGPDGVLVLDLDGLGGMDVFIGARATNPMGNELSSAFLLGHANRTFTVAEQVLPEGRLFESGGCVAGDLDLDGLTDVALLGRQETFCSAGFVGLRSVPKTTTTAEPTTGETTEGDSSESSGSLAGVIGASVGGAAALLAVVVACVAAFLCIAGLCALALVVCVLCVCMVAIAIVVVAAVGLAGGSAVAGGGGGVAMLLTRRKSGLDEELLDETADMDEVMARMDATSRFRRIGYDEIRLGKRIGAGAYGVVYVGEWQGVKVAVKTVTGALTKDAVADFEHEALMMAKVSHHPNVVQFIGASVENERLAMVLRFCDGGSLDNALKERHLDVRTKKRVLSEVAGALSFLHTQGMVHRDVAARNVLLDASMIAKLADLGLSRVLEQGADEQSTKSCVGPVRWMAPEALTEHKYSAASDAWSFGVLMWEVWSDGAVPYSDLATVADVAVAVVREGRRLQPPATCPEDHAKFMTLLMSTTPSDRPSVNLDYDDDDEEVEEEEDEDEDKHEEDDGNSMSTDYAAFSPSAET